MSKGVYVRRINSFDICEWKHKEGTSKYPCSNKAEMVVQSPKKGNIWKLCKKHATNMLGTYHQCNNCGCYQGDT